MKILLTTDTWAPTVNGVVTSTMALRAELQARGHEVRVLTLAGSSHWILRVGAMMVSQQRQTLRVNRAARRRPIRRLGEK